MRRARACRRDLPAAARGERSGERVGRVTHAPPPAVPRPLGIIMLETRFPRLPGDIGNPASFAFPVRYEIVRGASPERVIRQGADGLLAPFIAAARALEAAGCAAITTSCGFLGLFQGAIAAALRVPFIASSLALVETANRALPAGQEAGVITISASSLTPAHLERAGAPARTPVVGVAEDGEFARAILGDQPDLCAAKLRSEVLDAGRRLRALHPRVGAIVLECTNMPPYAAALGEATGVPIYDALTLARYLMGPAHGAPRR
ncbi:MAG: aspartate/glutamate racemase family protein [Burkholderiales bacterium]|nr:aspartate/glutamate racemase family protein [Burkholderiales bacterium]